MPVTGNGINYNGGPVMPQINLYFILYGNWSGLDATGPAILETWAKNIAPSPYFNIASTYSDSQGDTVPNLVTYEGVYNDTGSLGTSLTDASIGTIVTNAINAGFPGAPVPAKTADPNGVYMVLTAPGVAETTGFLTSYCGWHWSGSFVSGAITPGSLYSGYPVAKFAFIGNATGPSFGSCAIQSTSPNGDAGADAMISVMAHELGESATDPEGNAWLSSSGEEMGDLCAWNFGAAQSANGYSYNVTLNGIHYLMQTLWLNANGGSCALAYGGAPPDFSVSVSGSQTVSAGGSAVAYTASATDLNGFTGAVNWTYNPPSGIALMPTGSTSGNSFPFTLAAASSVAAGTYSIPITGTSGTLVHSLNATLVVTAPNFTVSVSGSQSVAPGGTTGSYTLSYSPVNGFSGVVTWTFATVTGMTITPAVNPLTGNGAKFTMTVASNLAPGTHTIQVTGTCGTMVHSMNATVVVTAPTPPSFTLSITPSSQSLSRPSSGTVTTTYTVKITPVAGFTGSVTLTASGGANDITPSIAGTNPVPFGGTGTLSVAVTSGAKKSTKTLTVSGAASGVSGNPSATATIQVK